MSEPASRVPVSVLDLFAGAGGLSAGLRRASSRFVTIEGVESDPDAAATFGANFPEARIQCVALEYWLARSVVPRVDVVVGGPPCQGFSALGSRDLQDERNDLWAHYVETVRRARPAYFVLENVPLFVNSPQFHLFRESFDPRGPLEDYRFAFRVLNAADYGSPQNRKRAMVIGHRRDLAAPGFPMTTRAQPRTVGDVLSSVPVAVTETLLPTRNRKDSSAPLRGPFLTSELHLGREYSPISVARFASIPAGGNRFDLPEDLKAPCWISHTSGSADVMGRLSWDKPSVTIRTEFFKPEKGRYLHPTANRAITHLEAALIQGFPRSYKWYGSKTSIARQIGNAVPIELGAAIGRTLLHAIDEARARGQLVPDQQ